MKTDRLEVIRLVVPAGKDIPPHQVAGEITVQCLEGRVAFTAGGATRELAGGQMLYLAGNEPHSLRGIEDAPSVLVTILLHHKRGGMMPRTTQISEEARDTVEHSAWAIVSAFRTAVVVAS